MPTGTTVVEAAFVELNVCQPNELEAEDATFGLAKLNRLLDLWNADQRRVYASAISTFTLTPNLNPHTIGLVANSPTLAVLTNRPESIEAGNIIVGSGTAAQRYPLNIRDRQWWLKQILPNQTSTIPTDLYYEAGWPNGSIYLYYVPSTAYTLELLMRAVLAQLTGAATFTLPPGYEDAITLTLAEDLMAPYHVSPDDVPTLAKKARDARATVFANNAPPVTIRTADFGIPSARGAGGAAWDWRSGSFRP